MLGSGVELTPEHPVDRLVELAVAAENAGVDAALVSCHYNNRDPFVVLDRIAAATGSLRLGPGVVNPYETHPVSLASRVATLHEVSDGRAVYGLGAGDRSTLANLGLEHDRPLATVRGAVEVARELFAGERVTREGAVTAIDAGLNYDVAPLGPIPIYVGAQGPGMLALAGRIADGVLLNASHPDDVRWALERIEEGATRRDDALGTPDVVAFASVSVADDPAEAREAARPPVAYIVGGARERVLERHGIDAERAEQIGAAISRGAFAEAFEAVTPAMIDAFCVAGEPAAVTERLEAIAGEVDGLVAGSPLGPADDLERAVSLAAAATARALARASR